VTMGWTCTDTHSVGQVAVCTPVRAAAPVLQEPTQALPLKMLRRRVVAALSAKGSAAARVNRKQLTEALLSAVWSWACPWGSAPGKLAWHFYTERTRAHLD